MTISSEGGDLVGGSSTVTLERRLPLGRSNGSRTWILFALGMVMLLVGVVCGVAVTRALAQPVPPANWNDLLERVAKKIQIKYDLTEAQQASLERIVHTHQPNLDRIRASTIREMRAELQQVIEETAAILTPDQASRYRAAVQPRLDLHFPAESSSDAKPAHN